MNALGAAVYIVLVAFVMSTMEKSLPLPDDNTILVPMFVLSLFVLSAAVMGFLFLYRPIRLYFDGYKEDATVFFLKTVGFFAVFVMLFLAALLYALPG